MATPCQNYLQTAQTQLDAQILSNPYLLPTNQYQKHNESKLILLTITKLLHHILHNREISERLLIQNKNILNKIQEQQTQINHIQQIKELNNNNNTTILEELSAEFSSVRGDVHEMASTIVNSDEYVAKKIKCLLPKMFQCLERNITNNIIRHTNQMIRTIYNNTNNTPNISQQTQPPTIKPTDQSLNIANSRNDNKTSLQTNNTTAAPIHLQLYPTTVPTTHSQMNTKLTSTSTLPCETEPKQMDKIPPSQSRPNTANINTSPKQSYPNNNDNTSNINSIDPSDVNSKQLQPNTFSLPQKEIIEGKNEPSITIPNNELSESTVIQSMKSKSQTINIEKITENININDTNDTISDGKSINISIPINVAPEQNTQITSAKSRKIIAPNESPTELILPHITMDKHELLQRHRIDESALKKLQIIKLNKQKNKNPIEISNLCITPSPASSHEIVSETSRVINNTNDKKNELIQLKVLRNESLQIKGKKKRIQNKNINKRKTFIRNKRKKNKKHKNNTKIKYNKSNNNKTSQQRQPKQHKVTAVAQINKNKPSENNHGIISNYNSIQLQNNENVNKIQINKFKNDEINNFIINHEFSQDKYDDWVDYKLNIRELTAKEYYEMLNGKLSDKLIKQWFDAYRTIRLIN